VSGKYDVIFTCCSSDRRVKLNYREREGVWGDIDSDLTMFVGNSSKANKEEKTKVFDVNNLQPNDIIARELSII
jgi:hypothetical protein